MVINILKLQIWTYIIELFSDIILRPSCYECKHNNFRSGSGITIGDYWGVSIRFPDYKEREEGLSLIINKTEKGKELFDLINNKREYAKSDIEHAAIKNPNIFNSSKMNFKGQAFFVIIKTSYCL